MDSPRLIAPHSVDVSERQTVSLVGNGVLRSVSGLRTVGRQPGSDPHERKSRIAGFGPACGPESGVLSNGSALVAKGRGIWLHPMPDVAVWVGLPFAVRGGLSVDLPRASNGRALQRNIGQLFPVRGKDHNPSVRGR